MKLVQNGALYQTVPQKVSKILAENRFSLLGWVIVRFEEPYSKPCILQLLNEDHLLYKLV